MIAMSCTTLSAVIPRTVGGKRDGAQFLASRAPFAVVRNAPSSPAAARGPSLTENCRETKNFGFLLFLRRFGVERTVLIAWAYAQLNQYSFGARVHTSIF